MIRIFLLSLSLNLVFGTHALAVDLERVKEILADKCQHCHGLEGEASNQV